MTTGFRSLHPLPCFLYYAGAFLLSMLLLHPFFLASAMVLLIGINLMYGSKERMARTILVFLSIGIVLFAFNPLFSQRGEHVAFYFMDRPVTLEAIWYGVTITLSTLSILLAFISYRLVVTNDKFLYLFSTIWPKGALITVMVMRFIPMLQSRLKNIAQMQRTKGISMFHGSLKERAASGMKLLQVLLTWSLEEALQTADSMKARGYGLGKRSAYTTYRMQPRDWLAAGWMALAVAACVVGWFYGYGRLTIYPSLESLRLISMEWVNYAVFILFLGTPLLMDGREWLRWR